MYEEIDLSGQRTQTILNVPAREGRGEGGGEGEGRGRGERRGEGGGGEVRGEGISGSLSVRATMAIRALPLTCAVVSTSAHLVKA